MRPSAGKRKLPNFGLVVHQLALAYEQSVEIRCDYDEVAVNFRAVKARIGPAWASVAPLPGSKDVPPRHSLSRTPNCHSHEVVTWTS